MERDPTAFDPDDFMSPEDAEADDTVDDGEYDVAPETDEPDPLDE
jgi:hypothetical protein